MRYELEMLEKILYYDAEGVSTRFPLYIYRTKEEVNKEALEAAVGYAIQCHPLYGCRLAEDEKGPYLETNPEKSIVPQLSPATEYYFGNAGNHNYPWVVGFYGREIIYTGHHGITDEAVVQITTYFVEKWKCTRHGTAIKKKVFRFSRGDALIALPRRRVYRGRHHPIS